MVYRKSILILCIILWNFVLLISMDLTPDFNQNQMFSANVDKDGQQIKQTPLNKHDLPPAFLYTAVKINQSLFRPMTEKNHPSGGTLLTDGALAGMLNSFLDSIVSFKITYTTPISDTAAHQAIASKLDPDGTKNGNTFLMYFANLRLVILHQLYNYLMNVYTTFNITHIDTIEEYISLEGRQALNKKTLIINHLVNIIERQLNQAILQYFPALPQHIATFGGRVLMKHDYGADINLLVEGMEEQFFDKPEWQIDDPDTNEAVQIGKTAIQDMRTHFQGTFGKYLLFFHNFTLKLLEKDPAKGYLGIPAFIPHAEHIKTHMDALKPSIKTNNLVDIKKLRAVNRINPPLFFFDDDTIRGIKIIVKTAELLPTPGENVPWPQKVVDQAKRGTTMKTSFGVQVSNHPVAYFVDDNGNETTIPSSKLFVNIMIAQTNPNGSAGTGIHSQEVLPQPDWLNTRDGVMNMLRACLGDYTVMLLPEFTQQNIFDPCLMCIISASGSSGGVPGVSANTTACTSCNNFITQLKETLKTELPGQDDFPDIGGGL